MTTLNDSKYDDSNKETFTLSPEALYSLNDICAVQRTNQSIYLNNLILEHWASTFENIRELRDQRRVEYQRALANLNAS